MASMHLSAAQELLLRRFIFPSTIEHVIEANPNWSYSLGEEPQIVINRFISERLLTVASLKEKLSILSMDELQKAMKNIGVTVEEVERVKIIQILSSSANELAAKLESMEMYVCTEKGRRLIIDGQTIRPEALVVRGARKIFAWLDRKGITGNFIYDVFKKIIFFLAGAFSVPLGNWIRKVFENIKLGIRKLLASIAEIWQRFLK